VNPKNFFVELKRRNVYKVAVAYAIVGWLVMQIAATVVPALHLSDAITSAVVLLVILGFPIALILAWAFELTPEGIKRTDQIETGQRSRNRAWIYIVIVAGAISVSLFFFGHYTSSKQSRGTELPEKSIAVYKVAVAYAVVGWLLIQIATQVFAFFEIPNWAVRLVVLLLIIGFPIAVRADLKVSL
jgi:hypothetical protein